MKLSESEEEYLESLYKLSRDKERVRVRELAENLGVKDPSVVGMLKKLEKRNLVSYERYSGCSMTEKGEEMGIRITRRHRLAERLLIDLLNRNLSQVHGEACRLEHSLTDKTADEIARVLDDPETCPHGYPIPEGGRDGEEDESISLSEGLEGRRYSVVSIPERKEDVQRLLPLAILPGASIILAENSPSGALMIKRGTDRLALSRSIASKIRVKPDEGEGKRRRHRGFGG